MCGFLLPDMVLKFGDLCRGEPAGKGLGDQPFKAAADVEDVAGFFQGGIGDRGAAIGLELDQALDGEPPEGLAHQRTADTELFADRVFGKLHARPQRLLDDRASQRLEHGLRTQSMRAGFRRHGASPLWLGRLSLTPCHGIPLHSSFPLSAIIVYNTISLSYAILIVDCARDAAQSARVARDWAFTRGIEPDRAPKMRRRFIERRDR